MSTQETSPSSRPSGPTRRHPPARSCSCSGRLQVAGRAMNRLRGSLGSRPPWWWRCPNGPGLPRSPRPSGRLPAPPRVRPWAACQFHSTGDGPTQTGGAGRSGLGREEDDLDPARGKLCQGGILHARDLGAEADRGDLARSEPAGRVDSVLLDQVLAYGVGLLLGQDLGKVDVVVIVGEGGDDDLRLWLT